MKLVLLFMVCVNVLIYADEFPQDSIFDLNSLEYNDSVLVPDYTVEISYGWFPRITYSYSYLSFELAVLINNTYDVADKIISTSLIESRNPLSNDFNLNDSDREIKKIKSKENEYSFPETDYSRYMFGFGFNPFSFLIVEFKTGFSLSTGIIASTDETKSYLNYSGEKVNFKEANIVELNDYAISNSIEFNIPFYGASFAQGSKAKNLFNGFSSFYYLIAGFATDYSYCSSANQYSQIANAKDGIRYKNGLDTIHLQTDKALNGLNRFRHYISAGIGMDFNLMIVGISWELKWKYPLTSILKDAEWEQHFIYMNLKIYGIL